MRNTNKDDSLLGSWIFNICKAVYNQLLGMLPSQEEGFGIPRIWNSACEILTPSSPMLTRQVKGYKQN